jgi:hydroxymethylpyrimidine pyrophosphatase-like HAD family hydrolase
MIRLLALDLDGTLVRKDGSYDPRDLAAVADARRRGIEVLLATGRLIGGTAPVARDLALTAPMVCADGATIARPDGELVHEDTIDPGIGASIVATMEKAGLHPFVFDHHACTRRTRASRPPSTRAHGRPTFGSTRAAPGTTTSSRCSSAWASRHPLLRCARISNAASAPRSTCSTSVPDRHVGGADREARRVRREARVRRVATSLGLDVSETACVGDWYNDVPMFETVGRSFVMAARPRGRREGVRRSLPR